MDQNRLPLWEKMQKYAGAGHVRLHVPAHCGGHGLSPELKPAYLGLAAFDLTELPGLDELHYAEDIIEEAQQLAADLYQADRTFFMVNGASAGVLAMLLASCEPGDIVLAPRNAHASFYHGLILSGVVPRYLPVAQSSEGFPLNVTTDSVKEAFLSCPEARAILITSPSYYGVCADIAGIAAVTHEYGAVLLLDEAHGAHLNFHPGLPVTAGEKADLRVQSWHKTLGALTPGAVLHQHGSRVPLNRVKSALQWVQTSSPSYPVLASLDAARKQMAVAGPELLSAAYEAACLLRRCIADKLPVLERCQVRKAGFDLDLTRLTILTGAAGINGIAAARTLSESGVYIELACSDHLLALFPLGYKQQDTGLVLDAFNRLSPGGKPLLPLPKPPGPKVMQTPRDAVFGPACPVLAEEALGRIAAAMVVSFPPGIPILVPGEKITAEIVEFINEARESGVVWRGLDSRGCLLVCEGEEKIYE